jgi:hypothetical protein
MARRRAEVTDLRQTLIDAMADAWARFEEGPDYKLSGLAFDRLREVAEVQLDAMLTVLAEHADEWWEQAKLLEVPDWKHGGPTMELRLIAILRDGMDTGPIIPRMHKTLRYVKSRNSQVLPGTRHWNHLEGTRITVLP